MKEKGDLARLENKWWYDRSECRNGDSKVSVDLVCLCDFNNSLKLINIIRLLKCIS